MRSRPFLLAMVGTCLVGGVWFLTASRGGFRSLVQSSNGQLVDFWEPEVLGQNASIAGEGLLPPRRGGATIRHLSNSSLPLSTLLERDSAILLENATIDTSQPQGLYVPAQLRSNGEPGAYVVQTRPGALAAVVRRAAEIGAEPVSYIPNNAWLVRASSAAAARFSELSEVTAVVPFEPWFKLKGELLEWAQGDNSKSAFTAGRPPTEGARRARQHTLEYASEQEYRVLLFGQPGLARNGVRALPGVEVLGEESSPFGIVLQVRASGDPRQSLVALARLPEVQAIERATRRIPANDLSRVVIGISSDSQAVTNWLGLTGSNVLIHVSDTGIDAGHPDLAGRIFADATVAASDSDVDGHGTHVGGIIAGSGSGSSSVVRAPGSVVPPTALQFRGLAPGARLLSTAALNASHVPDVSLQRVAAMSNALIAVHCWHYGSRDYDVAAGSYDAAVRDALPEVPGYQPILPVFAGGGADWLGTQPDPPTWEGSTVCSPGTSKNGITVGALENARWVSNTVWRTVYTNSSSFTVTNQPWLHMTDSAGQVWSGSPQVNAGLGKEGAVGRMKPDVVAPGTFVASTRSRQWDAAGYYAGLSFSPGNAGLTLSNLNHDLGPHYRFESGSSMAAAQVAGTLALLQEFLVRKIGTLPSPALLKALLINGARPVEAPLPNPAVAHNPQGWGSPRLPQTIPAALNGTNSGGPMLFVDQSPLFALSTGLSRTWELAVSPSARGSALRITLVWTDPPANPLAGVKLVNNLDLAVTNLESGEVFRGNVLGTDGSSLAGAPAAGADRVNNVENVFLPSPVGTRYSVTVNASQVHVAALDGPADALAQDFALVLSSEAVEEMDALTLGPPVLQSDFPAPLVGGLTNLTSTAGMCAWAALKGEKLGAHAPWPAANRVALPGNQGMLTLGNPDAWRIYLFTNEAACTNLAVLTFQAQRQGQLFPGTNANTEADVDLYVSTNAGLAQLEPGALAVAWTSLGRGGSEAVVLTNAEPIVYYIATKSESQSGAEYSLLAAATELPFAEEDSLGNFVLRGLPFEAAIPDRGDFGPGTFDVLAIAPFWGPVRRVVVSNVVTHARHGDLRTTLSHNGRTVTLRTPAGSAESGTRVYLFDDSLEANIPDAAPSSGPGSLTNFAGDNGWGQWLLTQADEVAGASGTNDAFHLMLERQMDLRDGVSLRVEPGATILQTLHVPVGATNLELFLTSGMAEGRANMELHREGEPVSTSVLVDLANGSMEPALTRDKRSLPPLNPGLYHVAIRSDHPEPLWLDARARIDLPPEPRPQHGFSFTVPSAIPDQALSTFPVNVVRQGKVAAATVGIRIEHPRISDLAIRLVSPAGKTALLMENRGDTSTEGLGLDNIVTNVLQVDATGGAEVYTNRMLVGTTPGKVLVVYDFYTFPDRMRIYRGSSSFFDSDLISGSGVWQVAYNSDPNGMLTIVMNEGDNYNPDTAWRYDVTSTRVGIVQAVYVEAANLAPALIKFVPPPFTNAATAEPLLTTNAPFFRPEESLDAFIGESAEGTWSLEVLDRREGAVTPAPVLKSWQLNLVLEDAMPLPTVLSHGIPHTSTIPPGHVQPYSIAVPAWARFSTNQLFNASGPVQLWYNASFVPTGTNAGDRLLFSATAPVRTVMSTNSDPALEPGSTYFVSLVNTGSQAITTAFGIEFDMLRLDRNTTRGIALPAGPLPLYFSLDVPTNLFSLTLQLTNIGGNLELLLGKAPRLPTIEGADYRSDNPGGEPEEILITGDSIPAPLEPGRWYIVVYNASANPSSGTLIHREAALPPVIYASSPNPPAVQLTWQGPPGFEYEVRWSPSLEPSAWTPFPGVVTSADGWFSFVDDGTNTGGLGQVRYYRVVQRDPAR